MGTTERIFSDYNWRRGLPVRLVVSPRTLRQASAEVKRRRDAQAELVPLESVEARVRSLLESS